MRKATPDMLAAARAQRWDPAEVLRLLIAEESPAATPPPAACDATHGRIAV
jgi:hypothetical protein